MCSEPLEILSYSNSSIVLILICCNVIDVLGKILRVTLALHLVMCDFLLEKHQVSPLLHSVKTSHVGMNTHGTSMHTSKLTGLLSSRYVTCVMRQTSRARTFLLISDNLPSSTSQELTSCNPSDTGLHNQTNGLFFFKVKCYAFGSVYVYLNYLTCETVLLFLLGCF